MCVAVADQQQHTHKPTTSVVVVCRRWSISIIGISLPWPRPPPRWHRTAAPAVADAADEVGAAGRRPPWLPLPCWLLNEPPVVGEMVEGKTKVSDRSSK